MKFSQSKGNRLVQVGVMTTLALMALAGCSKSDVTSAGISSAAAADAKPTIKIGYVTGWADSVATSTVAAQIIKTKLNYPVELSGLDAGPMWQGVARGDLDVSLSAWLPTTHQAYYEKLKDKVKDLGTNFSGAKIGLVVPDYVKINSIPELNPHKAEFDDKIVGIDAGAGIMKKTDEAIKDYNLGYTLQSSSGAAMTAALGKAIDAKKPIVVTGWTPHWMWGKWKVKYLADPKKVYGGTEHIDTIANPSLETKAKPVANFLRKFHWSNPDISAVMLDIQNGATPEAAANKWIAQHNAQVQGWLK